MKYKVISIMTLIVLFSANLSWAVNINFKWEPNSDEILGYVLRYRNTDFSIDECVKILIGELEDSKNPTYTLLVTDIPIADSLYYFSLAAFNDVGESGYTSPEIQVYLGKAKTPKGFSIFISPQEVCIKLSE